MKKICFRHFNVVFFLLGLICLSGCSVFGKRVERPRTIQTISVERSVNLFAVDENVSVIDRVQNILNGTNSFSGDFRQRSSNGDFQRGKIWLKKPGNMRIQYDSGLLLITDGDNLVYYDPKIDQKTLIDLDTTPAGVLVKKDIVLNGGDLKVLDAYEDFEKYFLTVGLKADAGLGRVEFILDKKTQNILGWTVKDSQGVSTAFEIKNYNKNIAVSKDKFILKQKKNFGTNGEVKNGSDFY